MEKKTAEEVMKTPEEIKKLIAKRNGFVDWNDLTREWTHRAEMINVVHEKYVHDAIEIASQELQRLSKENAELNEKINRLENDLEDLSQR